MGRGGNGKRSGSRSNYVRSYEFKCKSYISENRNIFHKIRSNGVFQTDINLRKVIDLTFLYLN